LWTADVRIIGGKSAGRRTGQPERVFSYAKGDVRSNQKAGNDVAASTRRRFFQVPILYLPANDP
jgi:hypothetical protein